jgi:hypothetical protein
VKRFPRLPRYEILIIAGVALVAFVVTLSVMASSTGARARRRAVEARQETERSPTPKPALSADELELTPDDFLVPQPPAADTALSYVPFRPRLERWSEEIAGKYWIPPREIAIDVLRSINDQKMKRLLQDVP